MVYNDIFPGFPWTQAFEFAPGVFEVDDGIRVDFRRHPAAPILLSVSTDDYILREGDIFTFQLLGEHTVLLDGGETVSFDFVRIPNDTHLGVRVIVPLTVSVTAP